MCDLEARLVIVGGGIAGVTCAEQLGILCPEASVILITESSLVKAARRVTKVARVLEEFDVEELPTSQFQEERSCLKVVQALVVGLDSSAHIVSTSCGKQIKYEKLLICTGGRPKLLTKDNPYVIGIRDTESTRDLQRRLVDAKRVVVVGNGGIATELVYELENAEIVWAIRDKAITATFVDPGAAEFLVDSMKKGKDQSEQSTNMKRMKYTLEGITAASETRGSALGPDWHNTLDLQGKAGDRSVHLEPECEVKAILTPEEFGKLGVEEKEPSKESWPVYVQLTNNHVWGCNFIVSATGVIPSSEVFRKCEEQLKCDNEGAILVDDRLRTSLPDVYAAGDVCTATWDLAKHWFQMKLWTQARQMGAYAARSIWGELYGEEILLDFCFELFTHVTKFFGFKVILLGLFNGQGLGKNYEILLRYTKGMEYIKVILQDGKMQGAVLIGETDLEETFENLILNQMDLTPYADDLLDPNIDIDDYFD